MNVREVAMDDKARVVDTMVMAFASDPVARWCWPNPHLYLTSMPDFAFAFGGRAFENAGAHLTEDSCGASLWLAPGVHPDDHALGAVVERTVIASVRQDLYKVLEQMAGFHPAEPHWYLPLIGVDPAHQGRGYGSALLAYAVQQCDRDRTPAYLESTNPRNVPLYQRYGFEVVGKIQAGTSPPLVPMVRSPR
jgi:ribosomal protein S18 acetylase RimI-like enzyme